MAPLLQPLRHGAIVLLLPRQAGPADGAVHLERFLLAPPLQSPEPRVLPGALLRRPAGLGPPPLEHERREVGRQVHGVRTLQAARAQQPRHEQSVAALAGRACESELGGVPRRVQQADCRVSHRALQGLQRLEQHAVPPLSLPLLELQQRLRDKPPHVLRPVLQEPQRRAGLHLVPAADRRTRPVQHGREGVRVERVVQGHDGCAVRVQLPAPSSAAHLLVLQRGQEPLPLAVKLREGLPGPEMEHDDSRRHVQAHAERLRAEEHVQETLLEQDLRDLPRERHDTAVVDTNATGKQFLREPPELLAVQPVFLGNPAQLVLDLLANDRGATWRALACQLRQHARGQERLGEAVAVLLPEAEHDDWAPLLLDEGREEPAQGPRALFVQRLRRARRQRVAWLARALGLAPLGGLCSPPTALPEPLVPRPHGRGRRVDGGAVHLAGGVADLEELLLVVGVGADREGEVPQRDWPPALLDRVHGPALDLAQPPC
mmetsp:Transcript_23687/g.67469  ORF Transcript_23687/g.67469 Transcript_23687/m.67469 type:complete len:489 (+) Transcript_23687:1058-2524(+)